MEDKLIMKLSFHERALRMIYEDSTSLLTLLGTISSLFLQCSNNRHTISQSDFSIPQVNRTFKVFRAFNMELNPNCFEKC